MERTEFARAFASAHEKYPRINRDIAWRFILDFEALLRANTERSASDRQSFHLLIRLALNDAKLSEKQDRKMYAALIGFLFGQRGRHAVARRVKNKLPSPSRRKKQPASVYDVSVNDKGQFEWRL